jgi:hypothetical protein
MAFSVMVADAKPFRKRRTLSLPAQQRGLFVATESDGQLLRENLAKAYGVLRKTRLPVNNKRRVLTSTCIRMIERRKSNGRRIITGFTEQQVACRIENI